MNELEDTMVETLSEEQNKGKRIKKNKDSLRYPWNMLNTKVIKL